MYPNGDQYEGLMNDFKRYGKGKHQYNNGDIYEGEWKNNKRDGNGSLFIKSNEIWYEGLFKEDEIISGKVIDSQENKFETITDV